MSAKQKSRSCPQCQSKKTEKMGEFAVCLNCQEVFHHSPADAVDTGISINDSLGGTENE